MAILRKVILLLLVLVIVVAGGILLFSDMIAAKKMIIAMGAGLGIINLVGILYFIQKNEKGREKLKR